MHQEIDEEITELFFAFGYEDVVFQRWIKDDKDLFLLLYDETKFSDETEPLFDTFQLSRKILKWCREMRMAPRVVRDEQDMVYLRFARLDQLTLFKFRWL